MKARRGLGLLLGCLIAVTATASGQEPVASPANDARLQQLRAPDEDTRIAALRELQTSLDPRLPEALLPLLSDKGNSIRRLAARGVGSRYWQIPAARVPAYRAALEKLVRDREHFEDVARMADRALGLLDHRYDGPMFSQSPNRQWVIYERRSLPALIDRARKNEELLGWSAEAENPWFAPSWGNSPVRDAALWHPESQAVALEIIITRKTSCLWVWKPAGSRLIKLEPETILRSLAIPADRVFWPGGCFVDLLRWHRGEIQFELFYSTQGPDEAEPKDHQIVAGWDAKTEIVRQVPEPDRPPKTGGD